MIRHNAKSAGILSSAYNVYYVKYYIDIVKASNLLFSSVLLFSACPYSVCQIDLI